MNQKRPNIITLFGDLNILYAIILILSLTPVIKLLPITVKLPEYLKFFSIPESIMKGFLAIFILIASYGYLKLRKWGYWLIVSEKLLFLVGWFVSYLQHKQNDIAPVPITTLVELIWIAATIKSFYKTTEKTPAEL